MLQPANLSPVRPSTKRRQIVVPKSVGFYDNRNQCSRHGFVYERHTKKKGTMKLAIVASLVASASAFAPASIGAGKTATALNAEKSPAIPFLPYPENCKGYVGEETGFDPLGLSNIFPMDYLREAELKHCRVAMLASAGFIAVDLGARIYPLAPEWEGLTAATAHDPLVNFGALGNIALFVSLFEMVSYIGVSEMLQGSGRQPGNFGFDPAGFCKNKSEAEVKTMEMKELANGRLAMMAFSGMVTQSVLTGHGFPYL